MNTDRSNPSPEKQSPKLTDLCQKHPLVYAGFRVAHLKYHDRNISETDEIPFVTTLIFPLAIFGYLAVARCRHFLALIGGSDGPAKLDSDGHIFSMTSTRGYRSRTFLDIASNLQDQGDDVALLCSPAARESRADWEANGFVTVSHRELHGHIPITSVLVGVVRSVILTVRLKAVDDPAVQQGSGVLIYNFVFLEYIKRQTVRPLTSENPSIHAFSPMPYLLCSTSADRVFAYQHGIQTPLGDKILSIPFFTPITLLIWGEPWRDNFRSHVHSETQIRVVGSPWYEYLEQKSQKERQPEYDVLFISSSQGLNGPKIETAFEDLVRTLIETCERHNYSLAVKLHPLEDASWYETRGWREHVVEFDDIDDALLTSRVSVTNASTAFVESAVLAVPTIVTDLWDRGLDSLAPVDHVSFAEVSNVKNDVVSAVNGQKFISDDSHSLVRSDGSVQRTFDVIEQTRE